METHPLFWLELRQALRNNSLFLMLVLGILMGFYLVLLLEGSQYLDNVFFIFLIAIPVCFFPVSLLLIPLSTARKLMEQRLNEDQILCTPLSPVRVLTEKFCMTGLFALCLYLPTVPGAVLLAVQGDATWLSACLVCFALTLGLTATGLGFMAGARTLIKTSTLVFLCGVYIIAALVLGSVHVGMCSEIFIEFGIRFAPDLLLSAIGILFIAFAGLIGFGVGVISFEPTKYEKIYADFAFVCSAVFLLILFGFELSLHGSPQNPRALFILFLGCAIFLTMPYLAVCMAKWERD